jgi:hypothetical protein
MEVVGETLLIRSSDEQVTSKTLRVCLDYLYKVSISSNLKIPAHFIGIAAEYCDIYTQQPAHAKQKEIE